MKSNRTGRKINTSKLEKDLLSAFYESYIADGTIDPKGKTGEQILDEARIHAYQWATSKNSVMTASTDHREPLLLRARQTIAEGDYGVGFVIYAIWFEHWINNLITRPKFGLGSDESRQAVRDIPIRGKFTWLLKLLTQRRLSPSHLATINKVVERRNSFVHYKFLEVNIDIQEDKQGFELLHRATEQTVKYLRRFELRYVFGGAKGKIRRGLRNRNPKTKR